MKSSFDTQSAHIQMTMIPTSLPKRLPKYEELQKQKFELQNKRVEQIMSNQKIQVEDFKGKLSPIIIISFILISYPLGLPLLRG